MSTNVNLNPVSADGSMLTGGNSGVMSLDDALRLVARRGRSITFHLEGTPGIGKTQRLRELGNSLFLPSAVEGQSPRAYTTIVVDCSCKQLGDLSIPTIVDHQRDDGTVMKITKTAPNGDMGLHLTEPVLLFLDELSKAPDSIKGQLIDLLRTHRLDGIPLPEGSIVVSAGNRADDNLNDTLPPHVRSSLTVLEVRGPNSEEWIEWATSVTDERQFGLRLVAAWAKIKPTVFQQYFLLAGGTNDRNPFIYDPTKDQVESFCCPRSLEKLGFLAADFMQNNIEQATLYAAAKGTIGAAAAADFTAFVMLGARTPSLEKIRSDREGALADARECIGAASFMAPNLVEQCKTVADIEAVMGFFEALDLEEASYQFIRLIPRTPHLATVAQQSKKWTSALIQVSKILQSLNTPATR